MKRETATTNPLAYCPAFQTPYPSPCPMNPEECEAQHDHGDHTAEQAARRIADRLGLTVRAAFKGDRCPPWGRSNYRGAVHINACPECLTVHGDRYRVTLRWRDAEHTASLSFDFWVSYQDTQDSQRPGYYDILGCVASDASNSVDPDEINREIGPMPPSQAFAIAKHTARLKAFFTEPELVALSEIQ